MHLPLPSTAITLLLATLPTSSSTPTMGFIGCSMAENTAQGYLTVDGQRMWGPYGTGGMVVQSWTTTSSPSWQLFDAQAAKYGLPSAVWVQFCIYADPGITYDEAQLLIANARQHAAPGARVYVTGQPGYEGDGVCARAGKDGPAITAGMARRVAEDEKLNVTWPGEFTLRKGEVLADGCHANVAGLEALGRQAVAFWG
ncbi:hypothetical protein C8A05DRAFT_37221 [Staphylotrichum tortipilum]|uniref:Sialate O-acetylesterase domain-containing protein n=1 Tax=Staphylotrichum tortipilum TaxID=2831512 RepID=A0AAN6ME67_9PEZI|nr:hypothetical protein C8A05DRAFT_37221 [Staphylotrichum longicolle]